MRCWSLGGEAIWGGKCDFRALELLWQISIILGILCQGIHRDHCLGHGEGLSSGAESPLAPGIGWQGRRAAGTCFPVGTLCCNSALPFVEVWCHKPPGQVALQGRGGGAQAWWRRNSISWLQALASLLYQDTGPWMPTLDSSREAAHPDFWVKSFCIHLPGLP